MKAPVPAMIIAISFHVLGCATSSYSVGHDFPSQNVNRIVKGETSAPDLVQLFGEPFTKTVISESQQKWIYTYSSGTAHAQSYVLSTKVETQGHQKTLDILLKDGVVANFAFTEGPGPYNATVH